MAEKVVIFIAYVKSFVPEWGYVSFKFVSQLLKQENI
jgi:hypothetical protein